MTFNTDHLIKYVEPEPHIPKKWIPSNSASPPPPPASLPSSTNGLSAPNSTSTNPCLKVLSSPQHTATHSVDSSNAQTQVNPSGPSTHSCSPDTFHASANSEENVINDLWEGKKQQVLWSKIGPYKLFTNNMMDLAPGKQLESEVVNAYLQHLKKRLNMSGGKKAYLIDSYQMTAIWKGSLKGLKKLDPSSYDVLFGTVCDNNHWTLIAMFPKLSKSIYIDPFGAKQVAITKCKDVSRSFMRMRGLNISRWGCHSIAHPTQQDSTSCGAFVCKLAENLLMEEKITFVSNEEGTASMRMDIARTLLRESDDLSQLCHYCGEQDKDQTDQWIECTECGRWYHWDCVGRPSTAGKYTCPACI